MLAVLGDTLVHLVHLLFGTTWHQCYWNENEKKNENTAYFVYEDKDENDCHLTTLHVLVTFY